MDIDIRHIWRRIHGGDSKACVWCSDTMGYDTMVLFIYLLNAVSGGRGGLLWTNV